MSLCEKGGKAPITPEESYYTYTEFPRMSVVLTMVELILVPV